MGWGGGTKHISIQRREIGGKGKVKVGGGGGGFGDSLYIYPKGTAENKVGLIITSNSSSQHRYQTTQQNCRTRLDRSRKLYVHCLLGIMNCVKRIFIAHNYIYTRDSYIQSESQRTKTSCTTQANDTYVIPKGPVVAL